MRNLGSPCSPPKKGIFFWGWWRLLKSSRFLQLWILSKFGWNPSPFLFNGLMDSKSWNPSTENQALYYFCFSWFNQKVPFLAKKQLKHHVIRSYHMVFPRMFFFLCFFPWKATPFSPTPTASKKTSPSGVVWCVIQGGQRRHGKNNCRCSG